MTRRLREHVATASSERLPESASLEGERSVGKTRPGLSLLGMAFVILGASLLGACTFFRGIEAVLEAFPQEGAVPLRVEFRIHRSTYGLGAAGTFTLDFGDETSTVQGNAFGVLIPHVYDRTGTYQARLTLMAEDGRIDEATAAIDVVNGSLPEEGSAVGNRAYDFTAPTTDGGEITLSELRGQVVLIEFWGSWCKPCKGSMPHINALWEAYHDQGLVVLAISTDTRAEEAVAYLAANGFTGLTCIWEPGGKSTRIKVMYEVDWIPRSVVVDRGGTVRYNGHPMELEAGFLEVLLAEPTPTEGAL
jgi:thiol-disulfide isomerase/thioredoxin